MAKQPLTPSFIVELPLEVNAAQVKRLLARLEAARQVYNACLGESLRRLRLKQQSRAYQNALKIPPQNAEKRQKPLQK